MHAGYAVRVCATACVISLAVFSAFYTYYESPSTGSTWFSVLRQHRIPLSRPAPHTPQLTPSPCPPSASWPGWSGIKYAFVFGDSYSATSFDINSTQPSPGNPLGNPPYPGYTFAAGPPWVDYLTVEYNASLLQTYNFAWPGAWMDYGAHGSDDDPSVPSLVDQVRDRFMPRYASAHPWRGDDTLFALFIGINDFINVYFDGPEAVEVFSRKILTIYADMVERLIGTGARNILLINIPPIERSPMVQGAMGVNPIGWMKDEINGFNGGIELMARGLKNTHADLNIFIVDANAIFNKALDKPRHYRQTSLVRNTTDYCDFYAGHLCTAESFEASCGLPLKNYFWLDHLHPTSAIHEVLADEVAAALLRGPNVCDALLDSLT